MARVTPRRKPAPVVRPPSPVPFVPPISLESGIAQIDAHIDQLVDSIPQLGAGKRPQGGSHAFGFAVSPQANTYQWRPNGFRRITGLVFSGAQQWALTKNGMTISSGGQLADPSFTALAFPFEISANQIIFVGVPSASQLFITGLNHPLYTGEICYISKNQASAMWINVLFDYE